MPITEKQRELRRKHIGSSDMAAILGYDPRRTGHDVFLEKAHDLEPIRPTEPMVLGNMLEPGLLDFAAEQLGPLTRNQYRSCRDLHLGSNIDAICQIEPAPVEAKSSGIFWPTHEPWGEPGTDEIPDRVAVQCHVHMICMGPEATRCWIPTVVERRGRAMYHVDRSDGLVQLISDAAISFWRCVEHGKAPAQSYASMDTVRRCRRVTGKMAVIPAALVEQYQEYRDTRLASQKAEKLALAQVLSLDPEAEIFDYGDEKQVLSFRKHTVKEHVVKEYSCSTARFIKRPKGD